MTPSGTLRRALVAELGRFAPFSAMLPAELEALLRGAEIVYFAPGQDVITPDDGVPSRCLIVRQGTVVGERPDPQTGAFEPAWELAPGDIFPLGALLGERAVTSRYRAAGDLFCVAITPAAFRVSFEQSAPFRDFCSRRLGYLLDVSRERAQAASLADATTTLSLASPLAQLLRGAPVRCKGDTAIGEALRQMDAQRIGSMMIVDADERPVGIFTQQDVIGRIVLPQLPLETPIAEVMSAPVRALPATASAGDAVMLMARHGIRHVAVVDGGRLAGVLSERDLFALQRLSSRQISSAIGRATDVAGLAAAAADIRRLARTLVAQGVAARQLTRLLSSLNDQLTVALVVQTASRHAAGDLRFCWLAFGSEGRHEQTIATDQDNGIIFDAPPEQVDAVRSRLVAFASEVNAGLARCGFPLCKGNVMAGNPRWCGSLDEWRKTFSVWIDRGDPESLLAASIFFDFRALHGVHELADRLRAEIATAARANARFLKQMAVNALRNRPPIGLFGAIRPVVDVRGMPAIDLKMSGAAPIVDAARIFALASGITVTNTAERLAEIAQARGVPVDEVSALTEAFDFIQLQRLQAQLVDAGRDPDNPNLVALGSLSELDQRILKEALRQIRKIQQRLALDYPG